MTATKPVVPVSGSDGEVVCRRFGFKRIPMVRAIPLLARDVASNSPLWLARRRQGLGASDLGVVLGMSKWTSPFALWWAKKGGWDIRASEAAEWGHRLEAVVAEKFAETHPELYVARANPVLWGHPKHPWLFCTPDRLTVGHDGRWVPLEIKMDDGGGGSDVPQAERIQVLIQCEIFGAPYGYLARLKRGGRSRKYSEYMIQADSDEVARCIARGQAFWESIENGAEPEIDAHPSTLDALQRLYGYTEDNEIAQVPVDLAAEWIASRKRRRDVEVECRRLDNLLRKALGTSEKGMTPDGRVFVRRYIHKREGYTVQPSMVDRLVRQ